MASKPKAKTYIVHHRGRGPLGTCMVHGRYKVGARNEKEAEDLLRQVVGKHAKVKVYYRDDKKYVPHGHVSKDIPLG